MMVRRLVYSHKTSFVNMHALCILKTAKAGFFKKNCTAMISKKLYQFSKQILQNTPSSDFSETVRSHINKHMVQTKETCVHMCAYVSMYVCIILFYFISMFHHTIISFIFLSKFLIKMRDISSMFGQKYHHTLKNQTGI